MIFYMHHLTDRRALLYQSWSTGWNAKYFNGSTTSGVDPETHHIMSERSTTELHLAPEMYLKGNRLLDINVPLEVSLPHFVSLFFVPILPKIVKHFPIHPESHTIIIILLLPWDRLTNLPLPSPPSLHARASQIYSPHVCDDTSLDSCDESIA